MPTKYPALPPRPLTSALLIGLAVCLAAPWAACAGGEEKCVSAPSSKAAPAPPGSGDAEGAAQEAPGERHPEYRRYGMVCMANAYPELKSEDLIYDLFDPIIGWFAPGIEEVNTFGNMRDNHLLWAPNIGAGYNISKHLSLFLQVGYGAGPVRTEDRKPSRLLLPLNMYFEMRRSAFTITPGVDWFPFGMVEQRDYHGLKDRLRAIRPMFGVRVPWTHAGYKANVKLGILPFEKIADIRFGDAWNVWSTNLNVGIDVPIDRRNQMNFNIGRSFFFGHDSDFGGPVFSVTWKYLF